MTNQRVIGTATTPTGVPGVLIECTCGTKHGTGRAIVAAPVGRDIDPTTIHGNVTLAHHPVLSKAPNTRQRGPWAA